jgi:hypothetical protein
VGISPAPLRWRLASWLVAGDVQIAFTRSLAVEVETCMYLKFRLRCSRRA